MLERIDFPARSAAGLAAMDVFYTDFNEINFYVEDADQENLYEVIFKKLFPEKKISKIFPLGGKQQVFEHRNVYGNNKKSVYLVDKDFDDFLEKKIITDGVFYLDRFCIENYLINIESFIEFVIETHPKEKREDVARNLDLDSKISVMIGELEQLSILFYLAQLFDTGIKNCSSPPESFCKSKALWSLCCFSMEKYKLQLNQFIAGATCITLTEYIESAFLDEFKKANSHLKMSGKFLIAMIFHYIKSKYKTGSITSYSFIYRVAKNSTLDELQSIATQIRSYIEMNE